MLRNVLCAALVVASIGSSWAARGRSRELPLLPEVAADAWSSKPRAKETTDAMHMRLRTDLQKMFSGKRPVESDSGYWRSLSYLSKLPWEQVPLSWKNWYVATMPNKRLGDEPRKFLLEQLEKKPLWQFTPKELDVYLAHVREVEPDLRKRVVALARKNLNQPYRMYLLGEFPTEIHDPGPMFDLSHGDCVVFSEHMFSMALSRSWEEFYQTLLKVRYKDGKVGMTTRNHFTEADWDKNNSWLVKDITDELGATTVTKYTELIDRSAFFANFGIGQGIPKETLHDSYIPAEAIASVADKLQDGDFVNVVRGKGKGVWVGHVGLIARGKDGTAHFIHSTPPRSKEQPLLEYVNNNIKENPKRAKKDAAQFLGLKFLRLRAEDLPGGVAPQATAAK